MMGLHAHFRSLIELLLLMLEGYFLEAEAVYIVKGAAGIVIEFNNI